MDVSNLINLITALQAESQRDAITPYSLGSLLRVIAALLGDAGTENAISTLESQLNAERTARQSADTAMATDISRLVSDLSSERSARMAADNDLLAKIVHKDHILELGDSSPIEEALVKAATKEVATNTDISLIHFTFENGKQSGTILQQVGCRVSDNVAYTTQIFCYTGYFSYRTISFYYEDDDQGHHAKDLIEVGSWNLFLGSRLGYSLATRKLALRDIANTILSEVTLPIVNTARNVDGLMDARYKRNLDKAILYVDSPEDSPSEDMCQHSVVRIPDGNDFITFLPVSTLGVTGGLYQYEGEWRIITDNIDVTQFDTYGELFDWADQHSLPITALALQTAWDTGSENSYIYSKKWLSGADNSRAVLACGTTLGQNGGKMKMRYVFWGGGGGKVYENIIPTATTSADGVMSKEDKAALEDLKSRLNALETRLNS